jgi:hypothetical protein
MVRGLHTAVAPEVDKVLLVPHHRRFLTSLGISGAFHYSGGGADNQTIAHTWRGRRETLRVNPNRHNKGEGMEPSKNLESQAPSR